MNADVLQFGFDGLKFTIHANIPPTLREELACAKDHAKTSHGECVVEFGSVVLSVTNKGARGFTAHTGDLGAVWIPPIYYIPNNPDITVDLRAYGLTIGSLQGVEEHFRMVTDALQIPYMETQLLVTRANLAGDILAPWFEPDQEHLVCPPSTKVEEYTGVHQTATTVSGARVTGLRAEVIQKNNIG